MSRAICIKCGKEKIGAFSPCLRCNFDPRTPEDQAKSLTLSDNCMTGNELRTAATRIQKGESLIYDKDRLNEIVNQIWDLDAPEMQTQNWQAIKGGSYIIVAFVLAIILFFWLLLR